MTRLGVIREAFADARRASADLLYPESVTWSDGVNRRVKVTDPNRAGSLAPLGLSTQPMPAALRLLRVHPDDPRPDPGVACTCSEGRLVLGLWTDEGQLSGSRTGVCRLVDERAYPLTATVGTLGFRLRVEAATALPGRPVAGNDLAAGVNDSHRLSVPPGVRLDPGEVVVTSEGDRYQVVPPVQRDVLGDTLGGAWLGLEADTTPTPGNDPTPATPDAPTTDPWWEQAGGL